MLIAFNANQVASWLKSFPRSSQRFEIISFHIYSSKATISTQAILNLFFIIWTLTFSSKFYGILKAERPEADKIFEEVMYKPD